MPNPERADIVTEMFIKASQGWSSRRLKGWLDEIKFTTRNGKPISVSSILDILISPFYYGEFQYSDDSGGKWFKGTHKPLIMCGKCGACMTAQEKFKKLKSGEYVRYVYYCCVKNIKHQCDEKYINENDLCKKLIQFLQDNHEKLEIGDSLKAKIEKHTNITKSLLDYYKISIELSSPFAEYSRYVLTNGTEGEKTIFADEIKTKILIRNGELCL